MFFSRRKVHGSTSMSLTNYATSMYSVFVSGLDKRETARLLGTLRLAG